MKIAIEARSLSAKGGGVRTYTLELIKALTEGASQHTFAIIRDRAGTPHAFPNAQELVVPLTSDIMLFPWLDILIPRALKDFNPDLIHYTKAAIPMRKTKPSVVTIHDIIPILFPQSQTLSRRLYWPWTLKFAARNSNHILTNSQKSKADMVEQFQIRPDKVTVTPFAIDNRHFYPRSADEVRQIKQRFSITKPYLLFVGTIEPRKNVPALLRVFKKLSKDIDHTLVIVGKKSKGGGSLEKDIASLGLETRVKYLDFIDYADLPALYTGADMFIWPSVYEGWGFPPHEALACGTRVIVSDGGSLPEVVGHAGIVVPFSENNVANRLSDTDFVQRLYEASLNTLSQPKDTIEQKNARIKHANRNSWKQVATTTIDAYTRTLQESL